jgi:hypothetical protein
MCNAEGLQALTVPFTSVERIDIPSAGIDAWADITKWEVEIMDSIIRAGLPFVWLAVLGSAVLLHSLPANHSAYSEILRTLQQYHGTVAILLTSVPLAFLTFILGLPTVRELAAGAAAVVFASIATVAIAAAVTTGWMLLALFLLVIPLSAGLFHLLLRRMPGANT